LKVKLIVPVLHFHLAQPRVRLCKHLKEVCTIIRHFAADRSMEMLLNILMRFVYSVSFHIKSHKLSVVHFQD